MPITSPVDQTKKYKMVEHRLKSWSYWYLNYFNNSLGYPKQSSFLNMPLGAVTKGDFYPNDNQPAEEINRIIIGLQKRKARLASIVRLEYTSNGTQTDKAANLKMTRWKYIAALNQAKKWIEDRIE